MAAVETTTKTEDLHTLIKLLEAKDQRIAFLEHRLRQRTVLTENKYCQLKKDFSKVVDMCYNIFLKYPDRSFTYDEFDKEFAVHYPHVPRGHLGRRLRDLYDRGKLWKDYDPETREARYWLKLSELVKETKDNG